MCDEDEFGGFILFVTTGLDEDWEVFGGCCRLIVAAVDVLDGLVSIFFAAVAFREGTPRLSAFAFPGFETLLLLLLSGTKGLFGFLSIVTLSFPASFSPFATIAGVCDLDDKVERSFDNVALLGLVCALVWLFGTCFTSAFGDDVDIADGLVFLRAPLLLL